MNRFLRRTWFAVAAAAIVVVMAQAAEAQRGEGRRGPGGFGGPGRGMPLPAVRLAAIDRVQEALNLTADQKEKVAEINDEVRDKAREVFEQQRDDFRQMRSQMEKLNDEASAKLADVLDDQQQKRLAGIAVQLNEAGALNDPLVAAELNLTDEQKSELADIRASQISEMMEQMRDLRDQDLSREEMRAKMEQRRSEAHKQLMSVLTTEQQAEFELLQGSEPVDIDLSRLRGPGRPPGVQGPGRRGERERSGQRGRDRGERRND